MIYIATSLLHLVFSNTNRHYYMIDAVPLLFIDQFNNQLFIPVYLVQRSESMLGRDFDIHQGRAGLMN